MVKRKAKAAEPERLITSDHLKMLARVLSVYDKHMETLHWEMADVLPTLPNEGEADLFRNVRLLRRLAQELGVVVTKAFEAQFPEEQAKVGS